MTANQTIDGVSREQMACMPVERCYDVRAKMIIAFNEAKMNGGDLDDALDAAYKSALRYSPNPMSAEQPAPVAVVLPERVLLRDIIAQAIGGDAYDCTRVWSAWGVGTMSDDDFIPIVDQEERLYEIADACLDEVTRMNAKSR